MENFQRKVNELTHIKEEEMITKPNWTILYPLKDENPHTKKINKNKKQQTMKAEEFQKLSLFHVQHFRR